jgi:anion-transporting  ArsA/GET3 family ATPase
VSTQPAGATPAPGLDALLASKEMVLVCGSGGVGKTTTAAAIGLQAATELGGRVLVLTVDPARRLASALGLGGAGVGNSEIRIDPARMPARASGELWMAMLDTKASWDDLVVRHAPDPATRDAILANPLYRNITSRFVHSHEYIAMERLHELHASGRYDLVIVDTPPSRNALDILDAPARMMEFFGSRLLRWLTVPTRSRLFNAASKPFYQVADRILGSNFLRDVADFFVLFQRMESGFVKRASETEAMLADARTTFVVVTTLEAAPSTEARYLLGELTRRNLPLGAVVVNRVLPDAFRSLDAREAAGHLAERSAELGARLAGDVGADPAMVGRVLAEVGTRFHDFGVVASRQAERQAELAALCPLVVPIPWLDQDVDDLAVLSRIGMSAWGRA